VIWEIYYGVLIFILGTVLGSFYNVCIYRLPLEMSVAYPPSRCSSCNHRLNYLDMIPIFSYFMLRGKCRYCKVKISPRYAIVELLTGLLFLLTYMQIGLKVELIFFLIFISFLIIITFIDIDHRIILDRFFLFGMILTLAYLFTPLITNISFSNSIFSEANNIHTIKDIPFKSSLIGALIGGGSLLLVDLIGRLVYKKESIGLGDVKLMMWVGAFLGVKGVSVALLLAIWTAAIIGIIILRRNNGEKESDKYMPFGPFLSLGSLISLLFADKIINWYLSFI